LKQSCFTCSGDRVVSRDGSFRGCCPLEAVDPFDGPAARSGSGPIGKIIA
jgi:hypothetical protein